MNYAHVKFEDFERERLDEIFSIVNPYSQMARSEKYFLNGAVRYLKPAKTLEVGIAYGGGTAIILNAIKDIPNAQLISADYCEQVYGGNTDKLSGYLLEEQFSHLMNKWTVRRGGDISRFIESIGGDIDLLVLDTAHIHPWETLNFLCVLPFMKNDSWVVLHDVSLNGLKAREDDLACRYLYSTVISDEKVMPVSDYEFWFANIGAFHVIEDTRKYVGNLFESLLYNWMALPGVFDKSVFPCATPMLPEDLEDITHIITKYYPEYSEFFGHVIEFQDVIVKHKTELHLQNYASPKARLKRYFPLSYAVYKAVKKLVKHS